MSHTNIESKYDDHLGASKFLRVVILFFCQCRFFIVTSRFFVAACRLSLAVVSGLPWLWSTGFHVSRLSSCHSQASPVVAHRLSTCSAWV